MQNKVAHFFQQVAVNPLLAARFADPMQAEIVMQEFGLDQTAMQLVHTLDTDALHNMMAKQREAQLPQWENMLGNNNNSNNEVSRFKRRTQRTN